MNKRKLASELLHPWHGVFAPAVCLAAVWLITGSDWAGKLALWYVLAIGVIGLILVIAAAVFAVLPESWSRS